MTEPTAAHDSPHLSEDHLSEDQVEEVLMDFASEDALVHLSGCALCQGRVQSFQETMAAFNTATLTWAEAKSSTMPLVEPTPARRSLNWAIASPVAAALVVGAALVTTLHTHHAAPEHGGDSEAVQMAAGASNLDPDPAQLAQDNAMLQAINTEMQPVESPLSPYGISSTPAASGIHAPGVHSSGVHSGEEVRN